MAKAALAEAERVEAEQRAKVEAPAKAEKARIVVDAEAEAEKRRLEAQGEASAIYAKLEAEARGQYEILAKKGEGLKQHRRGLRRRKGSVPTADARAPRQAGRIQRQGDLEHQVRQNRGLGKRPQNGTNNTANFLQNMARTHAADDASDARNRRRRVAGIAD